MLGSLLDAVGMAKRSNLYQKNALLKPGKHADPRIRLTETFHGSDRRYGYRRVHAALKSEEVAVSEKVVCGIMKDRGSSPSVPLSASAALTKARPARHLRTW